MQWIIDIVWYFQEPITIFNFRIISGLVAYSLFYCCFRSAGKCCVWRHKNSSKNKDYNEKWKGNQPLNIKTAVELPIIKLGLPNFRWRFYYILLHVASLLFRRIFMTSHMTLSSASNYCYPGIILFIMIIGVNPSIVLFFNFLENSQSSLLRGFVITTDQ